MILPQYLSRIEEIEAFEKVAHDRDAEFREIVLLDEKAASIDRFDRRQDDSAWGVHNRRLVELWGGSLMLASLYDQRWRSFRCALKPRGHSQPEAIEDTYAAVMLGIRPGSEELLDRGVSGTGKTTVCHELRRRGYQAFNGDRELAYQGDPETGEPTDGVRHENHIWRVDRVKVWSPTGTRN